MTFLEVLETFWISMYERGYIEIDDVHHFQKWISGLASIGYNFPSCQTQGLWGSVQHRDNGAVSRLTLSISQLGQSVTNQEIFHQQLEQQVEERCRFLHNQTKKVEIGLSDLHTGVSTDFTSMFTVMMAQKIQLLGIQSKHREMYPEVFRHELVVDNPKVSPVLSAYTEHKTQLDPGWPVANAKFYKGDPLIKSVDAFLCGFPPSRCQVWREFNKSTIFIAAHRYSLGRCSMNEWKDLNKYLINMSPAKGDFIGALSTYDQGLFSSNS